MHGVIGKMMSFVEKHPLWVIIVSMTVSAALVVFAELYVPPGKYTITLYSNNGEVIKSWETTTGFEIQDSFVKFKNSDGKKMRVSGNVVVEGK